MAWTCNEVLKFIEYYRDEPIIWNPKHLQHKNKFKVNDAWNRIADNINVPVCDLKKKKESLMSTFRLHHKKKVQSIKSGMGVEEHYNPIWPFYEPLAAFLKYVYECCSVINSEENEMMDSSSTRDETENNSNETTENCSGSESTNSTARDKTIKSKETAHPVLKRRSKNPPELTEASREMANAFGTLNKVLDNKIVKHAEDDCDLYAKLLAAKLRKFPENEREEIMLEIDGMLINRRRNNQNTFTNPYIYINRPSSSQSSYQSEWSRSSSPHNRPHSAQSTPSTYVTIPNQSPQTRPHSAQSTFSNYATIPNQSPHNRPHSAQSTSSSYATIPNQSPHNRSHSAQSTSSSYATIPNQSPHNRSHFVPYAPNEPQTRRIRILSNEIYPQSYLSQSSPAQTQQASSPEQPVELHIPEADETYDNVQSGSETQNLIFKAYEDA